MRRGRRFAAKGVPAQSQTSVCTNLLRHRKGYRKARGYSRSLQYQHNSHLYHHHRRRASAPYGEYATNHLKKENRHTEQRFEYNIMGIMLRLFIKKPMLREHRHHIMGIMLYKTMKNRFLNKRKALLQQNKGITKKTF